MSMNEALWKDHVQRAFSVRVRVAESASSCLALWRRVEVVRQDASAMSIAESLERERNFMEHSFEWGTWPFHGCSRHRIRYLHNHSRISSVGVDPWTRTSIGRTLHPISGRRERHDSQVASTAAQEFCQELKKRGRTVGRLPVVGNQHTSPTFAGGGSPSSSFEAESMSVSLSDEAIDEAYAEVVAKREIPSW